MNDGRSQLSVMPVWTAPWLHLAMLRRPRSHQGAYPLLSDSLNGRPYREKMVFASALAPRQAPG